MNIPHILYPFIHGWTIILLPHHSYCESSVTESKLLLFAAQQVNKSRNKLLGQGIATLFGKPAD